MSLSHWAPVGAWTVGVQGLKFPDLTGGVARSARCKRERFVPRIRGEGRYSNTEKPGVAGTQRSLSPAHSSDNNSQLAMRRVGPVLRLRAACWNSGLGGDWPRVGAPYWGPVDDPSHLARSPSSRAPKRMAFQGCMHFERTPGARGGSGTLQSPSSFLGPLQSHCISPCLICAPDELYKILSTALVAQRRVAGTSGGI